MSDDGTNWRLFTIESLEHKEPDKRHLNLPFINSCRILEVGCGIGRWSSLFIEKGLDYYGLDSERTALKHAKKNPGSYVNGDIRFLPFRDESVEYVFSCDVLQHFTSSKPRIILELNKVLKEYGFLIINEGLGEDWKGQLEPYFRLIFTNQLYPLGTSPNGVGKTMVFQKCEENKG